MHPRRPLRELPLSRLFPNLVTIAGLCCGLSSIRFAMAGKWELSVAFILAAALIDGLDGRIARMLRATSVFGAQLDSLSDFVCFGVAPALVLYMWQLNEIKGVGWALTLFYAVCCALRLARFNTGAIEGRDAAWQKRFFTGVPSPAGGILCLWPLILGIASGFELVLPPAATACMMLGIAILMISRLPTFAAKHVRVKPEMIPPVTLGLVFLLVIFIIEPWWAISLLSVVYLASIPLSLRRWNALKRAAEEEAMHQGKEKAEFSLFSRNESSSTE